MAARTSLAIRGTLESPDRHEARKSCLRIRIRAFRNRGSFFCANWIRQCVRKSVWIAWEGSSSAWCTAFRGPGTICTSMLRSVNCTISQLILWRLIASLPTRKRSWKPLRRRCRSFVARPSPRARKKTRLSAEQIESLHALGYMGPDSAASDDSNYGRGADPKQKIAIANLLYEAMVQTENGRYQEAVPSLE
jgi:hypothetical protein